MSQLITPKHSSTGTTNNSELNPYEFLAMVSHELRNPIQAILGWAEIVSVGPVDAETSARAIEVIKRSAQLQAKLLQQLLDFSRINKLGLRLDAQHVIIRTTVESAIETMTPQASAKTIDGVAESLIMR